MRAEQRAHGLPMRYDGRWRDRDPTEAPPGVPPVVRLKAPQTGETVIADLVQGEIQVDNAQLDDMVLLRADGTPTYMLSVVVDDIDMGITHVIRGDDHLTNTFRQIQLYRAIGAEPPRFAHIPLIHGAGRRQAQQAARRAERHRVSRDGLPARGHAQLSAAAGLGPWRRRDHLHRAGGSACSTSRRSAGRRRGSTWPSSRA